MLKIVRTNTYLIPFWGERGWFLKPFLASATVGNRLATVSQSSFLLAGRRNKQVRVRLGKAAGQLQVSRRTHPHSSHRVPGLLIHSCVNRFGITVCHDGGHVGTARRRRGCSYFLLGFGRFSMFWLSVAGWLNTWKSEGLLVAVEHGRGSVQEAGELLWDTLFLAELGVI